MVVDIGGNRWGVSELLQAVHTKLQTHNVSVAVFPQF